MARKMRMSKKPDTGKEKVIHERKGSKGCQQQRHPLAQTSGYGPPYVPTGWHWSFGNRMGDYRYTPTCITGQSKERETCRSKKEVKKFLARQDGTADEHAATLSAFMWPKDILGAELLVLISEDNFTQERAGKVLEDVEDTGTSSETSL